MSVSIRFSFDGTAASIIRRIFHCIRWIEIGGTGASGGYGDGTRGSGCIRNGMGGSANNGNRSHNVTVSVCVSHWCEIS